VLLVVVVVLVVLVAGFAAVVLVGVALTGSDLAAASAAFSESAAPSQVPSLGSSFYLSLADSFI